MGVPLIKRALVLSGGGAKGAFEAGVVDVLARNDRHPDVIIGVSTGSLGAVVLAQGHFTYAASRWLQHYNQIRSPRDIYRSRWAWGKLRGGLYNLGPLRDKIEAELTNPSWQRDVLVGVVKMTTGDYELISPDRPGFLDYVVASCSFPPYFPPVKIDGEPYMDGGLRNIAPLGAAIAMDCTHIDVVLASPRQLEPWKPSGWTWDIAGRGLEIAVNEILRNDLLAAQRLNRDVFLAGSAATKKPITIDVFEPDLDLWRQTYGAVPYIGTLEFKPAQIGRAIAHGREVAKKMISD